MNQPVACPVCGHVGPARRYTPGSFLIEVVLWLAFIVPGLVYSLWRMSARRNVCASCGNAQVVPLNSPVGQQILQQRQQG